MTLLQIITDHLNERESLRPLLGDAVAALCVFGLGIGSFVFLPLIMQ